jgi:uncharacterized protein
MLKNILNKIKGWFANSPIAGFLKPKEYVRSVLDINIDNLKSFGIKAVIIDLDDTLLPRVSYQVPLSSFEWVEKLKNSGIKIYMASNGSRIHRINYILSELKIEGQGFAFKPLPFVFNKAMRKLGVKPAQTAIIGDLLLTDVLGGNLLKSYTILVAPMSKEESLIRMPMRVIEEFLLELLEIRISF